MEKISDDWWFKLFFNEYSWAAEGGELIYSLDVEEQTKHKEDGYIKQRLSSFNEEFRTVHSLIFREFMDDEATTTTTRIYKDVFPNEMSVKYDLNEYLETIVNDLGDPFEFNDVYLSSPNREALLSFTHVKDNVPAIFDSLTTISDSGLESVENILSSVENIVIPSQQNEYWKNIGNYDEFVPIANTYQVPVIKARSTSGVYFDNGVDYSPKKTDGFYYFLNGDAKDDALETVFTIDTSGNVLCVGFDYDSNQYFDPDKRIPVIKNVVKSSFCDRKTDDFKIKAIRNHKLFDYFDDDDYSGLTFERAFGDSMFDLWKLDSGKLFDEMSEITFNKFIEGTDGKKVAAEVMFQVGAMLISRLCGPYSVLVYCGLTTAKALLAQAEQDNYIKSQEYLSKEYEGKKTLSKKYWLDEWFGDIMYASLIGNPQAILAPVRLTTDKYKYEGEIVLAPSSTDLKTEVNEELLMMVNPFMFGGEYSYDAKLTNEYVSRPLNFNLMSRNYMSYSDVHEDGDETLLREFLKYQKEDLELKYHNQIAFSECSITYLENAILQESMEKEEVTYSNVLPFMYNYYPLFAFTPSETSLTYPEFFEDLPMVVSEEDYELVRDAHDHIFKIWDEEEVSERDMRVVPKESVHDLESMTIDEIDAYLYFNKLGSESSVHGYRLIIELDSNDFTFIDGKVILNEDVYNYITEKYNEEKEKYEKFSGKYQFYVIFDIKINKFQSVASVKGAETVAVMQSVQAVLQEYYYQAYLATESQQRLNEVAYTVVVTILTTMFTGGMFTKNIWSEPLEECFLDPTSEAAVSAIVRDCGGDKYAEIIATTVAESLREGLIGELGSNSQSQRQNQKISQDQNLDQSGKTSTKLQINSKIKLVIGSLAIFAGALSGFGLAAAIGFGAMGTISQLVSYGINRHIQLKEAYKEALKQEKLESQAESWDEEIARLSGKEQRTYAQIERSLLNTLNEISLQNEYLASLLQKDDFTSKNIIKGYSNLDPIFKQSQSQTFDSSFLGLYKLTKQQLDQYEFDGTLTYTLSEIADISGLDPATAEKAILQALYRTFKNEELALSKYEQAFSKEEKVVQLEDGSWILEGREIEDCNKFAFTQSDSSQGEIIKEIHLPKGISLVSAKVVVQKAFGVNPSVSVDFYIEDQKIESGSGSTHLIDILRSLKGESIEIKTKLSAIEGNKNSRKSQVSSIEDLIRSGLRVNPKTGKIEYNYKMCFVRIPGDEKDINHKGARENVVDPSYYSQTFAEFVDSLKNYLSDLGIIQKGITDKELGNVYKEIISQRWFTNTKSDINIGSKKSISTTTFYGLLASTHYKVLDVFVNQRKSDYKEAWEKGKSIFDTYISKVNKEEFNTPKLYKLYNEFTRFLVLLFSKIDSNVNLDTFRDSTTYLFDSTAVGLKTITALKSGGQKNININNIIKIKNQLLSKYKEQLNEKGLLPVFEAAFVGFLDQISSNDIISRDQLTTPRSRFYNLILNIFPKGSIKTRNQLSQILYRDDYSMNDALAASHIKGSIRPQYLFAIENNMLSLTPELFEKITGSSLSEDTLDSIKEKVGKIIETYYFICYCSEETDPLKSGFLYYTPENLDIKPEIQLIGLLQKGYSTLRNQFVSYTSLAKEQLKIQKEALDQWLLRGIPPSAIDYIFNKITIHDQMQMFAKDEYNAIIKAIELYQHSYREYYLNYERKFKNFNLLKVDKDGYLRIWNDKIKEKQREILSQLSGGRSFLTGAKMTEAEIESGILHHWLTSIIEDIKKRDCSISALVLLNDQDHRMITSRVETIRSFDPIKAQHDGIWFEYIFSRVLEDLLNNRYPCDWDQKYRQEWEQENKDRKNTMGITYLFTNLNNFYSAL